MAATVASVGAVVATISSPLEAVPGPVIILFRMKKPTKNQNGGKSQCKIRVHCIFKFHPS